MISIHDLSFSYGKKLIFNGLTLDIPKGQFVSIIGPNGCGKSTLLKLIGGDIDYQQGYISIEGKSLGEYSTIEISKKLAFNRQNMNGLFPFTCLDYLLMGRRPHKKQFEDYTQDDFEKVEHVLKQTDTQNFLPKKLNEISGGELQRINVAKSLIQDTPYLLLDESFSAMDIYHTIGTLNLLKKLTQSGKTIVCVMHDLNLVYQFSDYVILFKQGKIYDTGAPNDVLKEKSIKDVYGIDVDYIDNRGFIFRGEM